jgi:hypothetical protein
VALGGVDPFGVSLYTPMETSSATTPLAVERVVLGGCIRRSVADLAQPSSALIYRDLPIAADGTLTDVDAAPVTNAITALYQRGLGRAPKDSERSHLTRLYRDIAESGESAAPARDWATLSCFSVLSTVEFLFY